MALKVPIFQGKPPRDRDHDGVSDKYDQCPDKPGIWAHHGCPDTDGDGVYDDIDRCPTETRPENHGCRLAVRHSDGVIDKLDSCPHVNHLCPQIMDAPGAMQIRMVYPITLTAVHTGG